MGTDDVETALGRNGGATGGKVDLGDSGIRIFGALWLLPAFGFLAAAPGLWIGWPPWMPVLVVSSLFSFVLTGADWHIVFMGAIVDVAIIILMPVARHFGWPAS